MVVDVKLVVPEGHPRADEVEDAVRSFAECIAEAVDGRAMVQAYEQETAPELTPRQLEVLRLLDQGLLTKQIALELGISPHTASNHVRAILRLLGAASRTGALHRARRLHLV